MSSIEKNLSKHDPTQVPSGAGMAIGVIVSEWNEDITFSLRDACYETLIKYGVSESDIHVVYVPGAFELPIGARLLAGKEKLDGVICLGCVIKGETQHDEYINNAAAQGIMNLSLTASKPIVFGLLTPNTKAQAEDRSGGKHGNKGVEAAVTALKMISLANDCKLPKKGIGF